MKIGARAVVVAIAIQAATPALADTKEDKRARRIMHDYARCVIRNMHDRAAAAIIANESSSAIIRRFPGLISSDCLGDVAPNTDLRFGGDIYRYALADALVNSEYGARGPASFNDRLPLAHLPFPDRAEFDQALSRAKSKRRRDELERGYNKARTVAALSKYGECIVRHAPEKSRLWLLTPPDGPEETSRIGDLRRNFSDCLGVGTIKFDRITIRGIVAINYYRLAHATAQPMAEKN